MPDLVFGVESYISRSLPLSSQRMLNCFLEKQPQGAKSQVPIFGAPGLTEFCTLPTAPVRGLWNYNGLLYAVSGNDLYSVTSNGTYAQLGTGIIGSGAVSMSDNGVQLVVVNGQGGYLLGANNVFGPITDPNFFPANTVLFFDGYFIFDKIGTNEFFFSQLYDGTTYNALDFATAEAKPGLLLGTSENLELLFLFCQNHIEMWYDSGAADTPFQRYAGGVIERGCAAPGTIVNHDDALWFLGSDGVFYRLQGNIPIRVSNHGVEHAIASYGDVSDAFCFVYTLEGHKMVHLNFPSVPHSWVFDISTQKWHERDSIVGGASAGRWRGNVSAQIYGNILIGDAFSGTISILDWNNYTELGNPMRMLAHSSPVHQDKVRLFINRLELDMEQGVGNTVDPGANPWVTLQWSKDGGRTWSQVAPARSMGAIGANLVRQRWITLGEAYSWVFSLSITDPVKRVLIATHLDAELGMR